MGRLRGLCWGLQSLPRQSPPAPPTPPTPPTLPAAEGEVCVAQSPVQPPATTAAAAPDSPRPPSSPTVVSPTAPTPASTAVSQGYVAPISLVESGGRHPAIAKGPAPEADEVTVWDQNADPPAGPDTTTGCWAV